MMRLIFLDITNDDRTSRDAAVPVELTGHLHVRYNTIFDDTPRGPVEKAYWDDDRDGWIVPSSGMERGPYSDWTLSPAE